MKITRSSIEEVLKEVRFGASKSNIIDDKIVVNINIFGSEVVLDIESPSPAMHSKSRLVSDIENAVKNKFPSVELDVRMKVRLPEIKQEKSAKNIKNIIAIASGKGGVGKSTVATNIAVTLSKMGFSVGILDADIYGPSLPIMFNVQGEKPLAVNVDGKSKIKPIESYGIKLLSIGFFTSDNQAMIWRGAMASKALGQLIHDADWGKLDFLIVDLPPGTGDIHLSIVQQIPLTGAVIVSTPQDIALADVKRGVDMFKNDAINVPLLGIIENMSYFTPKELPDNKYYIFGKDGVKNISKDLGVEFLGEIPLVQGIRESSDAGYPQSLKDNDASANTFEEITKKILTQVIKRNKDLPPTEIVKITTMSGCSAK